MATASAGLLLYRHTPDGGVEVLLAHMGGPFWARKDAGAWTLPKGEVGDGEDPHAAALREFAEELGVAAPSSALPDLALGEVRQRAGKRVVAWAREGDLEVTEIHSNTVDIEWPPRSGRRLEIPEVDRAAWFAPEEARRLVVSAQAAFMDRLEQLLSPAHEPR